MQVLGLRGPIPKLGVRDGARGPKMVHFESVISVYSSLPIVTKALSLTVFAEPSNVTDRRTDRQNWYSNSRPDAARYALASVAKIDFRLRRTVSGIAPLSCWTPIMGLAVETELLSCLEAEI